MAVVILGGLVTSTVLNLFVVPPLLLRLGLGTEPALASELSGLQGTGRAQRWGWQSQP